MGFMTRARLMVAAMAACCGLCCATAAKAQLTIPSNDSCSGATVLTANVLVNGTNVNATSVNDGPAAPCQATSNYRAVWFSFTPSSTGLYQVSACHSFFDTTIAIFTGACTGNNNASLVSLPGGCNDDQCGGGPGPGGTGSGLGSLVSSILLQSGQQYLIRLSGFNASGPYQIGVYSTNTTGACCSNIGTCTITSAAGCPTTDSTFLFQGAGSLCSPNPCVGACCNNTTAVGTCTLTPPGTGVGACGLGVWQGFGTSCTPATLCSVGTCCSVTGGCSITTRNACTGTNAWTNASASCAPNSSPCTTAVGACCTTSSSVGACYFGPLPCATGTVFAGFGSTCTPSPCAIGACCSSAQVCTQTVAASCTGSSHWLGAGFACTPTAPCTAACCDTTGFGFCILARGTTCPTGTVTMGVGTSCTPTICATGACCTTAAGCTVVSGRACFGTNQYLGDGSTCLPTNPCTALIGACCQSTGGCVIALPLGCTGTSTYLGSGVSTNGLACTPSTICLPSLGTCCSSTGACTITTAAGCTGTSKFEGAGVNTTISGTATACTNTAYCNSGPTILVGACCSTTGACSVTTALGCTGTSVFLGVNVGLFSGVCGPTNPCFPLLGTCCSATGACSITTAEGCIGGLGSTGSGTFTAAGTNVNATFTACASTTYCNGSGNLVPDQTTRIVGACCNGTACTVTTQRGCLFPGNFLGVNNGLVFTPSTACSTTAPLPCVPTAGTNTSLGACCNASTGACTVTLQSGCVGPNVWTFNAAYTGTTACVPILYCNPTLGTCCSATGACSVTTPVGCQAPSIFTAIGTNVGGTTAPACTATDYCRTNQPTGPNPWASLGACCGTGGACTVATAASCPSTSVFNPGNVTSGGTAAACSPATFCGTAGGASAVGACCSATGACTVTTQIGCVAPGTWNGAGALTGTAPTITCSTATPPCTPTLGACCSILGTCTVTTAAGCAVLSSNNFAGAGEGLTTGACTPSYCTTTLQAACCAANGSCGFATAAACTSQGGTVATASTSCTPTNPCVGACCSVATGACTLTTVAGCVGSHQGLNTTCGSTSYTITNQNVPLEDISTTGNVGPVGDDVSFLNVPIGFTFSYFGTPVSIVDRINSNGWLTLGATAATATGYSVTVVTFPAAAPFNYNGFVAPYLKDLFPTIPTNGVVRWELRGTAPNRRFIVEWFQVRDYQAGTANGLQNTFQVLLHETTNYIEFRYGEVSTVDASDSTFFVGMQNPTGTLGVNVTDVGAGATSRLFTPSGLLCVQPVGACCVGGACTAAQERAACVQGGGDYLGNGVGCSPTACPTGGCCDLAGACTVISGAQCALRSGLYAGNGAACPTPCASAIVCCSGAVCSTTFAVACTAGGGVVSTGSTCNPVENSCVGACCTAAATCILATESTCTSSLKTFAGAGTTCTTNPCPATGACCNGSVCTLRTVAACTTSTVVEGTTCTPNPCGGACCQGGGLCFITTDAPGACPGYSVTLGTTCSPNPCVGACCQGATCTLTPQGEASCPGYTVVLGTTCTVNPCVGPCCSVTGACTLTLPATCTDVPGQTFGGLGQTCTTVPCITGACCIATTCSARTSAGCTAGAGAYGGDGSNCFYNPAVTASVIVEDIRNTGTALTPVGGGGLAPLTGGTLDDGYRNSVPIGFSFRYFNVPATTVAISTNGWISMAGTVTTGTLYGATLPATGYNSVVGPFMDDLDATPANTTAGLILYQTKGVAPFRRFIVQWSRVEDFNGTTEHDFQVILHESSDLIEFRYSAVGAGFTGIQNAAGTIGMNVPAVTAPSSVYIAPITSGACVPFVYATGACCNGSTCSTAVMSACQVAGSIYNGNGVACSPTNPCIVGACCAADGTCTGNVLPAACSQSNGFYQGDFLSCTPIPAACNTGGCCLASDGSCEARISAACTGAGRFFLGAGNACGSVACPASGRCCVGPACVVGFEAECTNAAVNWRTGETCANTTLACAYCTAGSNDCNTVDEAIVRFTLNTIDNPSPYVPTPVGCYTDFTSISTTLTRNDTFPVVVLNQFAFTGDQCRVWVDWNKNNIFEQGGDEESILTTADNITFAGAITVPGTAPLGTTRLRARLMFTGTVSPCGTATYGEVEDYTVNVSNAIIGACCQIGTGQCAAGLSPSNCEAAAGVWQGLDTTCPVTNPCAEGACCLSNLTCVIGTQINCPVQGGIFQAGLTCTTATCPTNVGACCSGSSCSITFQAPCVAVSGNLWTLAAVCTPNNPCVGPCCSDLGTCTLTTAINCPGGASNFGTLGTACTTSACVGACCQGPTCIITGTAAAACPGYTVTRGTTCTPNPCAGACCQGAACTLTDAAPGSCPGYTVVIGTSCTPSPCAGACCQGSTCTLTTAAPGACPGYTVVIGTTCAPISPCVGACCQTATCTLTDVASCIGFTVTLGTTCTPGQCAGACCVGSACSVQSLAECNLAGGTYYGGGSNCFYQPPVVGTHPVEDISASAGATQLNLGDDTSSATIPIPFTFRFFGAVKPQLLINSNGWVGFSVPPDPQPTAVQMRVAVAAGTSALPPNDFIAAMWADLNQNAGQLISYEVRGTAPYRRFIAQWTNVALFVNTGSNTFQIILYESSDLVEIRYGSFTQATFGAGLENLGGDVGIQIPAASVGQNSSFSIAPLTGPCASFPYATGACCNGSTCTSGTLAACQIVQQSYQGDATGCSPNSACISGPCCTSGTCAILSNFACVAGGGTVQTGVSCTPDPCVAATGACCVAGACSQQTQAVCTGFFTAVGTACTPNVCPVCCRGTTCSTTIYSAAACVGSGTAGAVFVVGATAACGGANHLQPCCYADFNKIGGRNVTDIFNYLTAWFAGSRLAKVGGNGDPAGPVPQVGDIFAFLTDWFAGGCPLP